MLKQCQHKLSFSKLNWYSCALKAIIPKSESKLLYTSTNKLQCRRTATIANAFNPLSHEDMPNFVMPNTPLPPPVEPLQGLNPILSAIKEEDDITSNIPAEKYRRCNGFRRYDGQRCERLVQIDPLKPSTDQVLCFNHDPNKKKKDKTKKSSKNKPVKQMCNKELELLQDHHNNQAVIIKENRKFEAPAKIYDCWDLWIGKHIKKEQSNSIRQEMEKPISDRDKPGFIYAYSLAQGPRASRNTYAYFKIGRTTNPHRRMYQVSNICKMEPKIIEIVPSFPVNRRGQILPTNLHALDKNLEDVPKCPSSHRVERLIHLELSSLYARAGFKCTHCGSTHREWIRVNRGKHADGRLMTDYELWLSNIRPIILKWVQYGVVASTVKNSNI